MKISLGTDHAGFHYKEKVKALLVELGHEVKDFGTFSEEPVDYPKFIRPAAEAVVQAVKQTALRMGEHDVETGEYPRPIVVKRLVDPSEGV